MRTISKTIVGLIAFAFLGVNFTMNAQGDSAEEVKGLEFTKYLYSAESGSYEVESENEQEPKAFLGVMIQQAEGKDGLLINEFLPESAAEKAGIPLGAVLLTLDGNALPNIERLLELLEDKKPGDMVKIRYTYEDKAKTVDVKLGERPEKEMEEEIEMYEIRDMSDGPHHKRMKMRVHKDHPGRMEKNVIIRKMGPGGPMMGPNTLDIPEITVTRNNENGTVTLAFDGITGKVDVYLMGMNGKTIETVSHEDLQNTFSHEFVLGPGAQGMYQLRIQQGDKTHTEVLRF